MKLRPVNDFLVVRRDKREEKTKGGLYLPEQAQVYVQKGTIEEVGPGYEKADGTHSEMPYKVGDRIMFGKFAGGIVEEDDRELFFLRADDIFAVIESEK